jgi:PAS domain S-box-containing protein
VSRRTAHRWIGDGQLSASKLPGGHYRVHGGVLEAFIAVHRPDLADRVDRLSDQASLCWNRADSTHEHHCYECAAYHTQALHCFVLRQLVGDAAMGCTVPCQRCAHLRSIQLDNSAMLELQADPALVSRGAAILGVNDALCRLAGYAPDELFGMPYTQLAPQEDWPAMIEAGRAIRARGSNGETRLDLRLLDSKGQVHDVVCLATPFHRIWGAILARFAPH